MTKWILILTLFLSACATEGYRISDQNMSLGEIRRAVTAIIGEPRSISQNQRTFYSQYFSRKPDPKFDPQKSFQRAYAKVLVLGDRRPYDVVVSVLVEERSGSVYEEVDHDDVEARKLGKDLRARLNQGLENRNVIDDFRAF